MIRRSLAASALAVGLVVGALGPALADSASQGQNSSTGSTSAAGNAGGSNSSSFQSGPSASASGTANAQQKGSNTSSTSQTGKAKSGDSVAGSQVNGGVGGSQTVQNQNSSSGSTANGGDSNITLDSAGFVGPSASGDRAQVGQVGNNDAALVQDATSSTGDSVAGSQVTGLVGGDGDTLVVQNQNSSLNDTAITGAGASKVSALYQVGGVASATTTATVGQVGSNALAIDQNAVAPGGDSVAGSQVTGAVAGDRSKVEVQNENSASPSVATAISGDALGAAQVTGVVTGANSQTDVQVTNSATGRGTTVSTADGGTSSKDAVGLAGPVADTPGDAMATQSGDNSVDLTQTGDDLASAIVGAGPVAADILTVAASPPLVAVAPADTAQVGQLGDNAVAVSQDTSSSTGDAVSGSQVTGSVTGAGSKTTAQATNTADSPVAITADLTPANTLAVGSGPFGLADAAVQVSQTGDDVADVAQKVAGQTGDAVAGSQVTGLVGGEHATAQTSNDALTPDALSGTVTADNLLTGGTGPVGTSLLANALVSQNGDTGASIAQDTTPASGDALAGAQVTGRVA